MIETMIEIGIETEIEIEIGIGIVPAPTKIVECLTVSFAHSAAAGRGHDVAWVLICWYTAVSLFPAPL